MSSIRLNHCPTLLIAINDVYISRSAVYFTFVKPYSAFGRDALADQKITYQQQNKRVNVGIKYKLPTFTRLFLPRSACYNWRY